MANQPNTFNQSLLNADIGSDTEKTLETMSMKQSNENYDNEKLRSPRDLQRNDSQPFVESFIKFRKPQKTSHLIQVNIPISVG